MILKRKARPIIAAGFDGARVSIWETGQKHLMPPTEIEYPPLTASITVPYTGIASRWAICTRLMLAPPRPMLVVRRISPLVRETT